MTSLANIPILKIVCIMTLAILLVSSPPLYADTADELYNQGFKAYQSENYVVALKFLAAYKYHPDSKKADAGKFKSVDDAIQAIENKLTACNPEKHASGGGGGSFHGRAVLKRASDY